MDLDKIFMHKEFLQKALTFEGISKLYREVLYDKYTELKEPQQIHQYKLTRDMIDIITQMMNGRIFEEKKIKNTIKW